jgi:hypothetical protein
MTLDQLHALDLDTITAPDDSVVVGMVTFLHLGC